MDVLKEQRVFIKFCQKFGKTATESYKMLQQAFGDIWVVFPILNWLHVYQWWWSLSLTRRVWWCIRGSSAEPGHESDCLHNRSATPLRCSSSKTASQMVFWYLASAPQQCAMPCSPECQGILGQAQHAPGSPPALFTRFGPLQLLPLPQAEEHPEGEMISRRRRDTAKYNMAVAGHSQTSLPDMHWKVEGLLHTMWRVVLWRR
jgi:hypothetical protein